MITRRNTATDTYMMNEGKQHAIHHGRREPTQTVLENARGDGCLTLLDLGCNGGYWMDRARELGFQVIGVDHVPWSSAHIIWDCNDLSIFNDDSFDAVQMTEVIEHLETHPLDTLEELRRIAKHSVILSCPNQHSKWGGLQASDLTRIEEINYRTHKWYIPKQVLIDNAYILDDLSINQWTILRIKA